MKVGEEKEKGGGEEDVGRGRPKYLLTVEGQSYLYQAYNMHNSITASPHRILRAD